MKRREFLKNVAVTAGASMIPFLRYLPAEAAGPSDTLVVVSGHGINSLDLHRKGEPIKEEHHGSHDLEVAVTLNELANCHAVLGNTLLAY